MSGWDDARESPTINTEPRTFSGKGKHLSSKLHCTSGVATGGAGGAIAPLGSILALKKYNFSFVAINAKHEFHETCPSITLFLIKKDSNDAVTPQRQSQFTPKMKANTVPHLLSSLV